jgi:predicted dehydrogenase
MSPVALQKATELQNPHGHEIRTMHEIPECDTIDLAIVATTSKERAAVVRTILARTKKLRYLILEKILFDEKKEYAAIGALLTKRRVKTWVNHPRRMYPFHKALMRSEKGKKFFYHIRAGSVNGLMTNVTHYVDYFAHLAGSQRFSVDTSLLSLKPVQSKRAGYLELYGTLVFRFPNGSIGMTSCIPQTAPFAGDFGNATARIVFDETGGTAQTSYKKGAWKWQQEAAPLLYQSQMTGPVAARILKTGTCDLPDYKTSAAIHLRVLEPVRKALKLTTYQFS